MKIASWNVNSLKVRLPHVLQWLSDTQTDVLALQETKLTDENFPAAEIEEAGYSVVFSGQKTYNGVAVLSKSPITDVVTDVPELDDPQRRILAVTVGNTRIINLYVVNGSEIGSEKYEYKLHWLDKVSQYIEAQVKQHENLIVLGDFNIAPEDQDVYDPEAWHEKILCSSVERAILGKILSYGLSDVYRQFEHEPESYSWWDYRAAGFRRNLGMRIDLILATQGLSKNCQACEIDKEPRGWERPSDHAPVWAEFKL